MTAKRKKELDEHYKAEVHDPAQADYPDGECILEETDFHALTIGWAMAKGETISDA